MGVAAVSRQPAAFMSYVRFNDQHDDGQLTQCRERLAAEVRAQTGKDFLIFQDRNDIAWGQNWQTRINETLDAVTLLIPIITPSFFRSPPCREELERFLDRERTLGRGDLILPVYYISTLDLDDPERRSADELAQVVATRQYADWRELRFEPFTSPVVGKALAQLASRMRDTSLRPAPAQPAPSGGARKAAIPAGGTEATASEPAASARPTAKTEPPTHVVDPFPNRGDYTTISAAIQAAAIRAIGSWSGPVCTRKAWLSTKPLELLGDGPWPTSRSTPAAPPCWRSSQHGRVANLTLRQVGGSGHCMGWNHPGAAGAGGL